MSVSREFLLKAEDVSVYYGDFQALDRVNVAVPPESVVSILGANGSGKSTLLRTIAGMLPARTGSLTFDGVAIGALPPYRRADLGLAYVPEGRRIFAHLSVRENLEIGAYRPAARRHLRRTLDEVCALFPWMQRRMQQPGGTLSGGEQQMLAVGRALMSRPRLLLLDEPSLGLAPRIVAELYQVFPKISRQGITILLVEQNARLAVSLCDQVSVLSRSRVVFTGCPEQLSETELWSSYLT